MNRVYRDCLESQYFQKKKTFKLRKRKKFCLDFVTWTILWVY